MSGEERFALTPRQRAWLDSLPPERRNAESDELHSRWYWAREAADRADELVDALLHSTKNDEATGFLTAMALYAETFRAFARGDEKAAAEYLAAARRQHDGGPIHIELREPPPERS